MAASAAFLIARYFARERILKLIEGNKKFLAIDKAIGENGFWVVTLLRLSPLFPFSLGNYLYGLTSVKFVPYMLGMFASCWFYLLMVIGFWFIVNVFASLFGDFFLDVLLIGNRLPFLWASEFPKMIWLKTYKSFNLLASICRDVVLTNLY